MYEWIVRLEQLQIDRKYNIPSCVTSLFLYISIYCKLYQ